MAKRTKKNSNTKRPAFQFYPNDWLNDHALKSCSLTAQGLWIRLMCLMHNSPVYGKLLLEKNIENAITFRAQKGEELARLVGMSAAEMHPLLTELLENNVIRVCEQTGAYYSKRMVNDEHLRNVRAKAGSLGGKRTTEKQDNFAQANSQAKPKQTVKQKVPPSSSFSSSISLINKDSDSGEKKERESKEEILQQFEIFWDAYGKKVDRKKCVAKWEKLEKTDREKILRTVSAYVKAYPVEQYRKNPQTYLNGENWHDPLPISNKPSVSNPKTIESPHELYEHFGGGINEEFAKKTGQI